MSATPALAPEPPVVRHAGWIVALVAALAFANALANQFTYDDLGVIVRNPLVHDVSGAWRAFAHTYWPEETRAGQYRPLVVATYAIDSALSGGRAWWFHLVNVLWHAAASLLAWRLLRHVLPALAALGAALLFALHPLHVEAVANVVGRAELMMATFAIGALLLHRRASPWAVLLFVLAMLSKENGIVVPGLVVAYDLLYPDTQDGRAAIGARRRLYLGYAGAAVAYLGLLFTMFRGEHFVVPAPTWHGASTADRLLTMATVVPEWVRLLVAPFALSIDYTPGVIPLASGVSASVLLGLAIVGLAVAATVASWRRAPVVAFGVLWFAVAISPVANVLFPSGVVLAERTLYLPSVAAALLLGAAGAQLSARGLGRAGALLAAVLGLAYAARTFTRTPTWHDNKSLVLTVLEEHPESYRAHAFAASVHAMREDWASADRELAIARRIFQRDAWVYHSAAETRLHLGDLAGARGLLDTAVTLLPDYAAAQLRLSEVRYRLGDFRGAADGALRVLELAPDTVRAAHVVAAAAQGLGDVQLAIRTYRRALDRAPRDADLHQGYAAALEAAGDLAAARLHADSSRILRRSASPAARGSR